MRAPSPENPRESRARGILRALVGLMALFALTVGGIIFALQSMQERPANACIATLPASQTSTTENAPDDAATTAPPGTYSLSGEQTRNAALIAAVGIQRGMPARAVTIALATAMQESKLINITYGDRDSLGLFQQRPSQGWGTPDQIMDPVYAAGAFYDALQQVPNFENMPITEAAQAVQRSAFPDAYAQHEGMARAFASALTGYSPAALACDLAPPDPAADPAAELPARLPPDFGPAPQLSPVVDSSGGPLISDGAPLHSVNHAALVGGAVPEPERAVWVSAHWLTATAWETGVSVVVVGNLMWTNGTLSWMDAGALTQAPGTVLVG